MLANLLRLRLVIRLADEPAFGWRHSKTPPLVIVLESGFLSFSTASKRVV